MNAEPTKQCGGRENRRHSTNTCTKFHPSLTTYPQEWTIVDVRCYLFSVLAIKHGLPICWPPGTYHGQNRRWLHYVLPTIKIGNLFVLNTYKGKSCIKMIAFSREIDQHHHHHQFLSKWKWHGSAHAFWAVFYSSQRLSQISPTADFDGAAIPPPIFSMPPTYLPLLVHVVVVCPHSR